MTSATDHKHTRSFCACDLRHRAWNPNTGSCETCGSKFEAPLVPAPSVGEVQPQRARYRRGVRVVKRYNAWHQAIISQLHEAGGPLPVQQIWQRMAAAGFQHLSKMPRSTLAARIAELVQMKQLSRVGPATYQLAPELSTEAVS